MFVNLAVVECTNTSGYSNNRNLYSEYRGEVRCVLGICRRDGAKYEEVFGKC